MAQSSDFYAYWFSQMEPKPFIPQEKWEQHTLYFCNLASSHSVKVVPGGSMSRRSRKQRLHFRKPSRERPTQKRGTKSTWQWERFHPHIRFGAFVPGISRRTAGRNYFSLFVITLVELQALPTYEIPPVKPGEMILWPEKFGRLGKGASPGHGAGALLKGRQRKDDGLLRQNPQEPWL